MSMLTEIRYEQTCEELASLLGEELKDRWKEMSKDQILDAIRQRLERKPVDLKRAMVELEIKMVRDHGFQPVEHWARFLKTTSALALFTDWLNREPEAREILAELGFEWSMPENKTEGQSDGT